MPFDTPRSEAFAERLVGAYNDAALAIMTSVGHRTGLFDVLDDLPPSTSDEIAAAAGLDERYVREWLGAMVAGRVVEYDPQRRRYALPPEHAAFLTRAAVPNNLAATAQWIPVLGAIEDPIIERFRRGGGVPYAAYERFHQVMADESGQTVVAALEDVILPTIPGIVERLEQGIDVLDLGCGSGRAVNWLARRFPASRFKGYDLCEDAIATARAEANGADNATFVVRDVTHLDEPGRYDLVTAFDAIHDQAHPDRVLRNIQAALRAGGVFFMQDIRASTHPENNVSHPLGAFLYTISCLHCMSVSLSQGGAGLGAVWGKEMALDHLADAGFTDTVVHDPEHDIVNSFYVSSKAS